MLHARRKRWREALLAHLKAVEVEPESPGARFTLASFLATHGLEMAEAEYREAIAADPDHAEAHLEVGLALADMGRAADGLKESSPRRSGSRPRTRSRATSSRASSWTRATTEPPSATCGRQRGSSPRASRSTSILGLCYAQKGFYAEAERAYEKARALKPDDAVVNYDLASLYAQWGRGADALEPLRKAIEADPDKVRSWLKSDPVFDPMRGSDAFDQLVAG